MNTVLFVTNELKLSNEIEKLFLKNKYVVHIVKTNSEAYRYCKCNAPDVVFLVDHEGDRLSDTCLKYMRDDQPKRIILVMGDDFSTESIPRKLNGWADNYMPRNLTAQCAYSYMQAILKNIRRGTNNDRIWPIASGVYLDIYNRVLVVDKKQFYLPQQEFILLQTLVQGLENGVSKSLLCKILWGKESVECVDRLRKLISKCNCKLREEPQIKIKTLHSYGYILVYINKQ